MTHILDDVHHFVPQRSVELLIWCTCICVAPGTKEKLSVRVEVYRANDERVVFEVPSEVLCFQFRQSIRTSIVICTAVCFLCKMLTSTELLILILGAKDKKKEIETLINVTQAESYSIRRLILVNR